MLYPLKFIPQIKEKVWGGKKLNTCLQKSISTQNAGESWEISGIEGDLSIVSNGFLSGKNIFEIISEYKDEIVGKAIYEKFGNNFPLLIKFIDAADDLSVQVHPDDEFAAKVHNENGKNEFWYVIDVDNDAELILGFNKQLTKQEYLNSVENKTIHNHLNHIKVQKGDAAFIPAGRVHAIMKGVLLAEIQQTSDLTYRIYDWDRKDLNGQYRALHNDLASQVVDLNVRNNYLVTFVIVPNVSVNLTRNRFFTVNILELNKNKKVQWTPLQSFVILMMLEGNAEILYSEDESLNFQAGETILIPVFLKQIEIVPNKTCKFLEIYIES